MLNEELELEFRNNNLQRREENLIWIGLQIFYLLYNFQVFQEFFKPKIFFSLHFWDRGKKDS